MILVSWPRSAQGDRHDIQRFQVELITGCILGLKRTIHFVLRLKVSSKCLQGGPPTSYK